MLFKLNEKRQVALIYIKSQKEVLKGLTFIQTHSLTKIMRFKELTRIISQLPRGRKAEIAQRRAEALKQFDQIQSSKDPNYIAIFKY